MANLPPATADIADPVDAAGRIRTGGSLIGRDARLVRLRSTLDRVREEGRPRLAFITGAAGVGKSALLGAFVDQVAGEPDVLVAVATGVPHTAPYATLGQLLDSVADRADPRRVAVAVGPYLDVLGELAPAWRAPLSLPGSPEPVLGEPVLGEPVPGSPEPVRGEPVLGEPVLGERVEWPRAEHIRNRVHLALQRMVAALTERSAVVFAVDEWHHADRHSVEALDRLLATGAGAVLVAGACPTKEDCRVASVPDSGVVAMELRPLPDKEVTALIGQLLGLSNADATPLASAVVIGGGSSPLGVEQLLHALRGLDRGRRLTSDQVADVRSDFEALSITRYAHGGLTDRIWELRHNLTVYDAAYVALAEILDCPLVTSDARMAKASGHRADVEVYEQP